MVAGVARMTMRVGPLAVVLLAAACTTGAGPDGPRHDPEAPDIPTASIALAGDGYRFEVGPDGECLAYRVEASGFDPRGGVVCPHGEGFDWERHPQVRLSPRSSTFDLMVVTYDGCVRAPALQVLRSSNAFDSQTTTTICDTRVPAVVFGRLFGDVAYACFVDDGGRARFVETSADGLFLMNDDAGLPFDNGFELAFSSTGEFIGDAPVDAPFAPGLEACEAAGPWAEGG